MRFWLLIGIIMLSWESFAQVAQTQELDLNHLRHKADSVLNLRYGETLMSNFVKCDHVAFLPSQGIYQEYQSGMQIQRDLVRSFVVIYRVEVHGHSNGKFRVKFDNEYFFVEERFPLGEPIIRTVPAGSRETTCKDVISYEQYERIMEASKKRKKNTIEPKGFHLTENGLVGIFMCWSTKKKRVGTRYTIAMSTGETISEDLVSHMGF